MLRRRSSRPICLVSIHRSVLIAYGQGTLDLTWLAGLRRQLNEILPQGKFRGVILALQHVTHMPFLIFDPLRHLAGQLRGQGVTLVVCEQSAYLQQILDFGGLGKMVTVAPSVAEAIRQIKRQSHLIAKVG